MRNVFIVWLAALTFAGGAARAEDVPCGKWETSMGSFEEGERLATSYCDAPKGETYSIIITCAGGSLNLRFQPQIEGEYDKVPVDYAIDGKSFAMATQFEELDGAFAADVEAGSALVAAMKAGHEAVVTLKGIKAPAYKLPLAGFNKAITKLIRKCEK